MKMPWQRTTEPPPPVRQVSLDAVMNGGQFEPVMVTDDAIVVMDAPSHFYERRSDDTVALADTRTLVRGPEFGTTKSQFTSFAREEYNSLLRGQRGLEVYDQMRRSDGIVREALLALKTPITGATWFVQPQEETEEAKMQADFVMKNLTQSWMTYSWNQVLNEALLQFDFGYYMFEKVWGVRDVDGERRLILSKLAPRHPMDVVEGGWEFDANGGPNGVHLYDQPGSPGNVFIPIDKLCVFTNDFEAGNLEGMSVLRPAYKHWFYKENAYKIDGIQKERHGIGIPIIKLPPGFTDNDKVIAHNLGRNLRTNENAHIVLPPMWEIMFAKLEGQPVSALDTATHHAQMILHSVLASALMSESQGNQEAMMDLFYKSIRRLATTVADTMNQYVIPQLVGFNWDTDTPPLLKVRKLGDTTEARTISFALRNMVGAGIIQPDDRLEGWAREIIDAPNADPSSVREAVTPQNPGAARPARQSQAKNQRPTPGSREGAASGNSA